MSRLNQPALLFYRAISLLRHKSQVWFIGGVEHTSNEKMRGRCWLYKGHNTRHRQEQHMRKHSKPPAHEKWIKLSAVRGGDVHLKTATESSVNPPAHWASSRNRNIMMLAVVLGCNNQSLQGFFLGGCCSLKCLILWFEVFYCRGIAGKQEIHMHGNSVGNKDQHTLFSEVDVALRANRALWW